MGNRTTAETLNSAAETLQTAALGLGRMETGSPAQRMAGLKNLVVFGRAVTNVLQNLRSTEPSFDEWYAPFVDEMQSDPLLRHFYALRSQILKRGTTGTAVTVSITNLSLPRDAAKFGPPPPGATGFFVGDQMGGTGWEIPQPDGSIEKYYIDFPTEVGSVDVHLTDAPTTHLGRSVLSSTAVDLGKLYLAYLEGMVRSARARFSTAGGT
jgi:hypothetical protein